MVRSVVSGRAIITGRPGVTGRGTTTPTKTASTPTSSPGTPTVPIQPPLPNAPIISAVTQVSKATTQATYSWHVDQPCQGWLEYGTANGGPYPSETTHETSLTYVDHEQTITGLTPNTTYYAKVVATNGAAQVTHGTQFSFTTDAVAPTITFPPSSTSTIYVPTTTIALPTVGVVFNDAQTGVPVKRVSGQAGTGPRYPKVPAWNIDHSFLWAGYNTSTSPNTNGYRLFDGNTYEDLGARSDPGYYSWSMKPSEPNVMYSTRGSTNTLRKVTMTRTTSTETVVHTFTGYNFMDMGSGEGAISRHPSDPGRYCAMWGRKTAGTWWIVVYDFTNDSFVERQIASAPWGDITMSPLGTYVVPTFAPSASVGVSQTGTWLLSTATLADVRQITRQISHNAHVLTAGGDEVVVDVSDVSNSPSGQTVKYRLADGVRTMLLPNGTVMNRGHVSGMAVNRAGKAYMCSYGDATGQTKPLHDVMFTLDVDTPGLIERFAMARHTSADGNDNSDDTYNSAPFATPCPDGSHIAFKSRNKGAANSAYYLHITGMDLT